MILFGCATISIFGLLFYLYILNKKIAENNAAIVKLGASVFLSSMFVSALGETLKSKDISFISEHMKCKAEEHGTTIEELTALASNGVE